MKKTSSLSKITLVNSCLTCQNIKCIECIILPDGTKSIIIDNFILNKNLFYYVKLKSNPRYYELDKDWSHLITLNIRKAISNSDIKVKEVIKIYNDEK
jgi:hypothetical protein